MANRSHHEVLEEIRLQFNVVRHSTERLGELIASYGDMVPSPNGDGLKTRRSGSIKSLDVWIDWLKANGPSLRQTIWDATGVNLATSATPQVRKWKDHMEMWSDGELPPDTLFNIQGTTRRKGRPPVIYFLWSQRFDVFPIFDVGPERETDYESEPTDTVLGVIQPPDGHPPTWDDLVAGAKPWPEQSFDFAQEMTPDEWRADNGYPSHNPEDPDGYVNPGEYQSNEDGEADG